MCDVEPPPPVPSDDPNSIPEYLVVSRLRLCAAECSALDRLSATVGRKPTSERTPPPAPLNQQPFMEAGLKAKKRLGVPFVHSKEAKRVRRETPVNQKF